MENNIIKNMLISWMEMQLARLKENKCSSEEIIKSAEIINRELDTDITRNDAMKHLNTY